MGQGAATGIAGLWRRTGPRGRAPGLLRQFILLAGVVLTLGMFGTGLWVSDQIRRIVVENAAAITALYVDAMISPVAQVLEEYDHLSVTEAAQLQRIVVQGELSRQVSAFKLWNDEGRVIFSTRPQAMGQRGDGNPRLAEALAGGVHAALRTTPAAGGRPSPLLEVYSPILSSRTGRVIGVAEFYTTTDALRADLRHSQIRSWLVVGLITAAMFAALCTIVIRGDRIIRQQQGALDDKLRELSRSLDMNRALNRQIEDANLRIAEIGDMTLRRVSAELHDGPAQQLAFAAMRIDGVPGQEPVADAVTAALRELRLICRGLMLPEVSGLDPATLVRRAVAEQEARGQAQITLQIAEDLPPLPPALKNCLYRFVQETLNNGARHAPGAALSVTMTAREGGIAVTTTDNGPGFDPAAATEGLGLLGLRERVLGLGGQFSLQAAPGRGTSVGMWLPAGGSASSQLGGTGA